jgi:hypothetical protein
LTRKVVGVLCVFSCAAHTLHRAFFKYIVHKLILTRSLVLKPIVMEGLFIFMHNTQEDLGMYLWTGRQSEQKSQAELNRLSPVQVIPVL